MTLPYAYYPEWWNVNDHRTSHSEWRHSRFADDEHVSPYGGGRCLMGHFGRVGACSIDLPTAEVNVQCSIDKDIVPTSYCTPIHCGIYDCEASKEFTNDVQMIRKIGARLEHLFIHQPVSDKLLKNLKSGLLNCDRMQLKHTAKSLPRKTNLLLRDTKAANLMWNEARISSCLRTFDRKIGGKMIQYQMIPDNEDCFLLYAGGMQMNWFYRFPYDRTKKVLRYENNDCEFELDSRIREIDVSVNTPLSSDPNLVVLTNSKLYFFSGSNESVELVNATEVTDSVQSVRLNPYLSSQYVVARDCRSIVFDLECDQSVFESNIIHPLTSTHDAWCQSSFTNNLFKILYCDSSQLRLTDIRRPNDDVVLFSVTNLRNKNEYFVSQPHKPEVMDNYHIACTNYKNYLLDQRMPEQTVLEWSSALLEPQSVNDLHVLQNGMSWLLTGGQMGKEVAVNCFDLKLSDTFPPQLISTVKGCSQQQFLDVDFRSSRSHDVCADRISQSLLFDLCAIPHGDSIDCLQLLSSGDIFCQSFRIGSTSASCQSLDMIEDESLRCDDWTHQVLNLSEEIHSRSTAPRTRDIPHELMDCCRIGTVDSCRSNSPNHTIIDLGSFSKDVPDISPDVITMDAHSRLLASQLNEFLECNDDISLSPEKPYQPDEKVKKKQIADEINRISTEIAKDRENKEKQAFEQQCKRLRLAKERCFSFIAGNEVDSSIM